MTHMFCRKENQNGQSSILDEMKLLIQQTHGQLEKEERLLNDQELAHVKWAHEQTKANNEIENIFFTQEEEELFKLFAQARLPLDVQGHFINVYLEKVLRLEGYKYSSSRKRV